MTFLLYKKQNGYLIVTGEGYSLAGYNGGLIYSLGGNGVMGSPMAPHAALPRRGRRDKRNERNYVPEDVPEDRSIFRKRVR